jgi:hypothetical protein
MNGTNQHNGGKGKQGEERREEERGNRVKERGERREERGEERRTSISSDIFEAERRALEVVTCYCAAVP